MKDKRPGREQEYLLGYKGQGERMGISIFAVKERYLGWNNQIDGRYLVFNSKIGLRLGCSRNICGRKYRHKHMIGGTARAGVTAPLKMGSLEFTLHVCARLVIFQCFFSYIVLFIFLLTLI